MKKVFTITLLAFLFFACQNDSQQADSNETTAAVQATANQDDHAGHNHGSATPKHHSASALSPYVGKWTYYHALKDTDYYKGRYIDFKVDGTFTSGVNDKETNSGSWSLDEKNNYLEFDYADNSVDKDEQWKSQKNTPDVIILIGNAPKNTSGNQIKLDRVIQ